MIQIHNLLILITICSENFKIQPIWGFFQIHNLQMITMLNAGKLIKHRISYNIILKNITRKTRHTIIYKNK